MRGGEGLSRVAENSYFAQGDTIYIVHYGDNNALLNFQNSSIAIQQSTQYPFSGNIRLTIKQAVKAKDIVIKLNALSEWSENLKVTINDKNIPIEIQKGFVVLKHNWKANDIINFSFDEKIRMEGTINKENCSDQQKKVFYGPLLLGYSGKETIALGDISKIKKTSDKLIKIGNTNIVMQSPIVFKIEGTDYKLTPLYHLMNPEVKKGEYKKQFLFNPNPEPQPKL